MALPQVKEIVSGNVQVEGIRSNHLQITTSDKAIINYDSFNIAAGQQVTFIQPKSTSAVLNRVQSGDVSSLMGQLNANGRVFLINPHGIIIGPSGYINAASFIASTLDIADGDFLSDRFQFSLKPGFENSSIVNQGHITCPEGFIAILAPRIRNEGIIKAKAGKAILACGEKITLDFSGDDLMSFSVEGEVKEAVIEHLGKIEALGGEVFFKLKVADEALKRVINLDSFETASCMVEENGIIRLVGKSHIAANAIHIDGAGKAEIDIQGGLDASRTEQGEIGGSVQIFGDRIHLEGAEILASGDSGGGNVLIGGNYQGLGDMQQAKNLTMDMASTIHADALIKGDGGSVILWSKDSTVFNGKIFAQGGKENGNGGLVETSGKKKLDVSNSCVNTLARYGKAGNWLLDPLSINVATGGVGTLAQGALCSDAATSLTIDPLTINSAASNVTLCASSGITFSNNVAMTVPNVGLICTANNGNPVPITFSTASITTTGGSLLFNGAVTLTTDTLVDTTNSGSDAIGAPVSFLSTINATSSGAQNLTVNAGTGGDVYVEGNIGTTALGALSLTGGAGLEVVNISTTASGGKSGNIVLNSTAGLFLNGSTYTSSPNAGTSGSITLNGGCTLGFVGNTTFTTTNAAITINGDVNVPNGTTTNGFTAATSNGNFILNGDVGSMNNQGMGNSCLNNFNIASGTGTITLENVGNVQPAIVGPFTLNSATAITLNGSFYNVNGAHSYTGPIILGAGSLSQVVDLISNSNPITFSTTSTINAANAGIQGLNVNGGTALVTFGGTVGTTPLSALIVDGLSGGGIRFNSTAITTSKDQLYALPVVLGADITFTSTNSPISFKSTIDGARNFSVSAGTGAISIGGVVGSIAPLRQISLTGRGGILLSGNITTSTAAGTFTATGNVALNTSVNITTSSAATLITGVVDGTTAGAGTLMVNTSGGGGANITITGDIGTSNALSGLNLNAGSGAIAVGGVGNATAGSTGGLSFTASGGITLNGNGYTTSGGSQAYNSNISLGTTTNLISQNTPINFAGTINGAKGLMLDTGTSAILFGSTIGNTIPLNHLISHGTGTITTTGNITTVGDQFYNSNVNLAADTTFTTSNNPITFASTVNGARNFLVSAGPISIKGDVGSITPVHQVSLNGKGGIFLGGNVTTATGAGTFTATGSLTTSTSVSITTNSAAALITGTIDDGIPGTSTLTINTSSGGGANITIVGDIGTVNSLSGLVLNAGSGSVAVGGVGNAAVGSTGGLVFTGSGGITLNGSGYTTSGFGQFYNNNVTLGATTTLTTNNQTINFLGTVNGAQGLTLNLDANTVLFNSTVGNTTPLNYLVSLGIGTVATNSNITTTGGQLYNSAVTLNADTIFTTTNSPILFSRTIDGAFNFTVAAGNGEISVERDVGGLTPVHRVSLTGTGGIKLGGNVTTATPAGTFTAIGGIAVGTNVAIHTDSASASIQGNIDGTASNIGTLTIDTSNNGGADITISGNMGALNSFTGLILNAGTGTVTVGGVGGAATGSTGGLTFTGGGGIVLDGGRYTTSGASQVYNNNVTLVKTSSFISTNQPITFAGTVNGAFGMTANAGTNTLVFNSTVGNSTPLSYLFNQGTGTTTVTGNITTTGSQSYDPAVSLAANTLFTTTNAPVRFISTVNGARNFQVAAGSGAISLGAAVGGITPVTQVSLTGRGGILLGGNITTSTGAGTLTATGDVAINANTTITTNSAAVLVTGTVDGTTAGAGALTVNTSSGGGANITITGDIGTARSLTGLSLNAGTGAVAVGGVGNVAAGSTGGLTFTGSGGITLNGSGYMTSGAGQVYNNNVILGTTASLTSTNQPITFTGTVNGAQGLTLNAGTNTLSFNSTAGNSAPLKYLMSLGSGPIATNGAIATVADQLYSSDLTIGADATFTTVNSPITFTNSINGPHNLLITTGKGSIFVGGTIGNTQPLHLVTMTGNGGINISGITTTSATADVSLTSTARILLNGNINTAAGIGTVTAEGDVTFSSSSITTSASTVTIHGDLDGITNGTENMNIDTTNSSASPSGASVALGNIGTRNNLTSLNILTGTAGTITVGNVGTAIPGITSGLTLHSNVAGTGIFLNGSNYNTTGGTQRYIGNVQLATTATLTSNNGDIIFDNKINGTVANQEGLVLNAGLGFVTLNDTVGATNQLLFLTITAADGININNGGITTAFNQIYNSRVILGADATFTANNSAVTFADTINGNASGRSININVSNGAIIVNGPIGSTGIPIGAITMLGDTGITLNGIGTGTSGLGAVNISSLGGILLKNGTYRALSHNYAGSIILAATTSITSAVGQNILLSGIVNGDGISPRSLTMTAPGAGNVTITGGVGQAFPLTNLTITANNIDISDIGGPNAGVTGTTTLNGLTDINFTGSIYYANNPTFTAGTNFNILQIVPTNINALIGPILFNTGSINLPNLKNSLVVTTDNANITIPKLIGISQGHFLASAGSGTITVGDAPGPTFTDITMHGGTIVLTGPLTANSITIVSDTNISNLAGPNLLTAQDLILLDALGGDVGTLASPIDVSSTGFVICGATGEGFYTGVSGDGTVHCLPSNPPQHITFNGSLVDCTGTVVCPLCPLCPVDSVSDCPSNNSFPPSIPPSFVAVNSFEPSIYAAFQFNLASDFYFFQNRAAECIGNYAVYNSLREPDEKCVYDHMFWIPPKKVIPFVYKKSFSDIVQ